MAGRVHPPKPGHSGLTTQGGSGGIEVKDEGTSIGTYSVVNFVGGDVSAIAGVGQADIYIPAVSYASHWNTSDGDTGNQSVNESISRSTARISTPNGGEGTPFQTGGWAGSNQAASLQTSATFTTPGVTTGFGGDATAVVTMFAADGTTVLETYTTPALTGNATHTSGNISVTISSYAADDNRFQAKMSVTVAVGAVLTGAGYTGGRYNCRVVMNTDTATDGTGPYTYTQPSVFLDTNPSTPSVGALTIAENSATTKHISGLEYYTTGSTFTIAATNINNLNENTARTTQNLRLSATEYAIGNLNQSPFGTGSANFSGYTSDNNNTGTSYSNNAFTINLSNRRYAGTAANASAFARDTWSNGATRNSANATILVDTYSGTSTSTLETFNDEAQRKESDYTTNWTSTADLTAGEAMVYGGQLISPDQASLNSGGTNSNWTSYAPNAGAQPNYTGLTVPVSFYRQFLDNSGDLASFTLTFSGTFISNATTDLANSNLEIFVRRIAGNGSTGTGANPLRLHGSNYNFASFDDGATVSGSYIRESSSSGNTVNGTFGGFAATQGIYIEVKIVNSGIKITSMEITFF